MIICRNKERIVGFFKLGNLKTVRPKCEAEKQTDICFSTLFQLRRQAAILISTCLRSKLFNFFSFTLFCTANEEAHREVIENTPYSRIAGFSGIILVFNFILDSGIALPKW